MLICTYVVREFVRVDKKITWKAERTFPKSTTHDKAFSSPHLRSSQVIKYGGVVRVDTLVHRVCSQKKNRYNLRTAPLWTPVYIKTSILLQKSIRPKKHSHIKEFLISRLFSFQLLDNFLLLQKPGETRKFPVRICTYISLTYVRVVKMFYSLQNMKNI